MSRKRTILLSAILLVVSLVGFCVWFFYKLTLRYYDCLFMSETLTCFAGNYGRMPYSFEEMIEKGYIYPEKVNGSVRYRTCLVGGGKRTIRYPLRNPETLRVAWGLKPPDLVFRHGRIYRRDDPTKEVFLLAQTDFPLSSLRGPRKCGHNWLIYEAMLRRWVELHTGTSQPAAGRAKLKDRERSPGTQGATSVPWHR